MSQYTIEARANGPRMPVLSLNAEIDQTLSVSLISEAKARESEGVRDIVRTSKTICDKWSTGHICTETLSLRVWSPGQGFSQNELFYISRELGNNLDIIFRGDLTNFISDPEFQSLSMNTITAAKSKAIAQEKKEPGHHDPQSTAKAVPSGVQQESNLGSTVRPFESDQPGRGKRPILHPLSGGDAAFPLPEADNSFGQSSGLQVEDEGSHRLKSSQHQEGDDQQMDTSTKGFASKLKDRIASQIKTDLDPEKDLSRWSIKMEILQSDQTREPARSFAAIVDSGSELSFVRDDVMERLGAPVFPTLDGGSVISASGQEFALKSYALLAWKSSTTKATYHTKFYVLPRAIGYFEFLLGRNWSQAGGDQIGRASGPLDKHLSELGINETLGDSEDLKPINVTETWSTDSPDWSNFQGRFKNQNQKVDRRLESDLDSASVRSDESIHTMDTEVTRYSNEDALEAAEVLTSLIAQDEHLRVCFRRAALEDLLTGQSFEDALRIRIKTLAKNLSKELNDTNIHKEVVFISKKARATAHQVRELYFPSVVIVEAFSDNQNRIIERTLGEEYYVDEEHSSDDEEDPTPPPKFGEIRDLLVASTSMQALRESFERLLKRQAGSWQYCQSIWAREVGYAIPTVLTSTAISVIDADGLSWTDRVKAWLEDLSGSEWIWDPWCAPRRYLAQGQVFIQWKCDCDELLSERISKKLADLIQSLQSTHGSFQECSSTAAGYDIGPGLESQAGHDTELEPISSGRSQAGLSEQDQGKTHRRRLPVVQPATDSRNQLLQASNQEKYVLVAVDADLGLKGSSIKLRYTGDPIVKCISDDDEFFTAFRNELSSLRGWRWYLDPMQFAYCHFSKLEKWDVNELGWRKNELPPEDPREGYECNVPPPREPYNDPICKHQWRKRFYQRVDNRRRHGVIDRLPKRSKPFGLSDEHQETEYMWGLYVQLRPSFKMCIAWQIFILSPGFAFMIWFLATHPAQWYQSTALIFLILALEGSFLAFWDKYKVKKE